MVFACGVGGGGCDGGGSSGTVVMAMRTVVVGALCAV